MPRVGPSIALLLLAGCFSSRGFDRGALTRAARVEAQEVTDAEIARVLALRPQLTFPIRVAVWFRPPPAERWSQPRFEWREEDRRAVLEALRPLAAEGIVAEIAAIPATAMAGDDLRAARLAAARHGADGVLVVAGATDVDRHSNAAAVLYATLVGLWLVPGTRADGIFLASATLWDVRNEFLYATAEAEGTFGRTRPALLLEDEEMIGGAKRLALAALGKELGTRVRNLRQAPSPGARAPERPPHPPVVRIRPVDGNSISPHMVTPRSPIGIDTICRRSGVVLLLRVRVGGSMRITSKGQVTIPVELREKAGLLPDTEVEFELDSKGVRIRRAKAPRRAGRGAAAVGRLRGRATVKMSTDEIMALTRPE